MNELKIFENEEFGQVRTVEVDGQPWFSANDVAVALGYKIPKDAVTAHCKGAVKYRCHTSGGEQEMKFIPESDIYRLIIKSKLPSAERFEKWVMEEVLPSIRKHGAYMTESTLEQALTSPDFIIQLATKLKEEQTKNKRLDEENKTMQPKALFADAVSASKTSILVGDLAKLLKQNGIDIGQKRLFQWLRDNGYLIKQQGMSWNMPTQRSMEAGLFEIKETTITHSDGHISVNKTVKVTGAGQVFFINKFLSKEV